MSKGEQVYFGPGTTPERVAEAIDKAQRAEKDRKPRATTSERERFFSHVAEERKRAEAGGR